MSRQYLKYQGRTETVTPGQYTQYQGVNETVTPGQYTQYQGRPQTATPGQYLQHSESRNSAHAYATLNGTNMLTAHKMELLSYSVGNPVPVIRLIEVPGRPGKLDATLALNGKVNYSTRPITVEFHVRDITQEAWRTLMSTMFKLYDGTETKLVLSTDPDWYYKGRFTVTPERSNPVTGKIVLQCDEAFPYKLEAVTVSQSISSSGYVTCVGKDYNGPLTVYCSSAMSMTFGSKTYQLASGNNSVPEIHLASGNNSIRFVGSGTVRITYERGIL